MRTSVMTIIIAAAVVIIFTPLVIIIALYGSGSPAYVTGRYTCTSPVTGMPDYCELLSDDTYVVVPWSVYNTASYGSVLSYSSSQWTVTSTPRIRQGYISDVSYSSWRTAKRVTNVSGYSGMSSRIGGVTGYRSSSGFSSKSSFRGR